MSHFSGSAFFDFDDTLIRGDSIVLWNRFLFARRPSLRRFWPLFWLGCVLWIFRLIPTVQLKTWLLSPTGAINPHERDDLAKEFAKWVLENKIQEEALEQWKQCEKEGLRRCLFSASGEFYLMAIGELLKADETKGTPVLFDNNFWGGCELPQGNFKGPQKKMWIESHPDWLEGKTMAFSDHKVDLPMLELAQNPIAVGPEPGLAALARTRGWSIIEIAQYPSSFWDAKKLDRLWLTLFP